MSNITPGPWYLTESGIDAVDAAVIVNASGDEVLGVSEWCRLGEADARLFLAAPDLLEAARPFEEIIQEGSDDLPDDTGVTVKIGDRVLDMTLSLADFRALQRAIVKAGGQPLPDPTSSALSG